MIHLITFASGASDLLGGQLTPTALVGAVIALAGLIYRQHEKEIERYHGEIADLKKQNELLLAVNKAFTDSLEKVIPFIDELNYERRERGRQSRHQ